MKKGKNFSWSVWYGTLRECVDELYKMIDFKKGKIPGVDFAASVGMNEESAESAHKNASGWFGIKEVGEIFNADTITLIFGHYGGGGIESLELTGEYPETEKELLIQRIGSSTDDCGYGVLESDDFVVFEVFEEEGK